MLGDASIILLPDPVKMLIGFKAICIALVANVFVFPILQSPHDVALIFQTCQLPTDWEFLHGNGGSERPAAAWHGQLLHWQDRQQPEKYQTKRFIDTKYCERGIQNQSDVNIQGYNNPVIFNRPSVALDNRPSPC